jgi:hypothetical protein
MRAFAMMIPMLAAVAAPAFAQDETPNLPHWGTVGEWAVRIDPSHGNGCLIERNFPDGTLVQIGAMPVKDGAYMGAWNIIWTEIRDGQKGDVEFSFSSGASNTGNFSGEMIGTHRGYLQGGEVFFNKEAFLDELATSREVTITGRGGATVMIDLAGTAAGIAAVRQCQSEQN